MDIQHAIVVVASVPMLLERRLDHVSRFYRRVIQRLLQTELILSASRGRANAWDVPMVDVQVQMETI